MAKLQLRYVIGSTYYVEGVSEKVRHLKFVGRLKMGKKKQEHYVFKPIRKVKKFRNAN